MKKTIVFFSLLFIIACAGQQKFEPVVLPQTGIVNPTFSVHVEGRRDGRAWLKEEIENALLRERVRLISFNANPQLVTRTTGEGKIASAQDEIGNTRAKAKVDSTSTTEFQTQVKADFLFNANYDHWTFTVISMKDDQIVAKGKFTETKNVKNNVKIILKQMGIIP